MPLSDAQQDLHWNARYGWGRVCQANDWYATKGRLLPEATKGDFSQWHKKVWAFAELLARQNNRAVTPDDLRKGTYMLALGVPKSLTKFENGDLDRVLIVFRLLIEPDDLRAVRDWMAYEAFDQAKAEIARCKAAGMPVTIELPDDPGERRRHLHNIERLPEAVKMHLVRHRFGGTLPEDMSLKELRQFSMIVKNRRDYGRRTELNAHSPVFIGEAIIPDENIPF